MLKTKRKSDTTCSSRTNSSSSSSSSSSMNLFKVKKRKAVQEPPKCVPAPSLGPPITDNLIKCILPTLSNQDFEKFMLELGPQQWKLATETCSSDSAKALVVLITKQSSLNQAFSVFLSLWEMDQEPATFLFELGMGIFVRQSLLVYNAKNTYLTYLRMDLGENHIFPVLPWLKHNKHYFCLNKIFAKKEMPKKVLRIDDKGLSEEDAFLKKLASAQACAFLQRWSECFSFSLSALDNYQPGFLYLHDVFCNIALAGIKMAVPFDWCCQILEEAKQCATSFETTWKRGLVFQTMLIEYGFFELELEVFQHLQKIIAPLSDHFQTCTIQHVQSLLAQVEFNLTFQYIRQHFHSECPDVCEKEPFLPQTFAATEKLLSQVDALCQNVFIKGVKEYFKGYFYLYSTMLNGVFSAERCKIKIQLATSFFQLAKKSLKRNSFFYSDVVIILAFLNKTPMTIGSIEAHFQKKSPVLHTLGANQFFFRACIISMYLDNIYQPFPIGMLVTCARDLELKVRHKQSYKLVLLDGVHKMTAGTFNHVDNKSIKDFPSICSSEEKMAYQLQASLYWFRETSDFHNQPLLGKPCQEPKQRRPSGQVSTSQELLKKNRMAEQVYAFGFQIVESWTVDSL